MKRLTVSLLLCVCLTLLLIPTVSFGATKAPNVEPNATRDYSLKYLFQILAQLISQLTTIPVTQAPTTLCLLVNTLLFSVRIRSTDRLYFAPLMQVLKHRYPIG